MVSRVPESIRHVGILNSGKNEERIPSPVELEVERIMRWIGIILVLIGGLTLGYRGFESKIQRVETPEAGQVESKKEPWWHLSPIAGGIVLVSGLLLLASSGRREES
jgi:hypothetical protein